MLADKEEFDQKMKKLSQVCSSLMNEARADGDNGGQRQGPTIDEVDLKSSLLYYYYFILSKLCI